MPLPPTITDSQVTLTFGTAGQYYGYCTVADVRYEFPNISSYSDLATDNAKSRSIIGQEITYAAQELQDALILIYVMPYTGTDGGVALTLRNINAKLAAANLIRHYYDGAMEGSGQAYQELRAWAEVLIKDIQDGVTQLSTPFGDAVAQAEHPVYPRSALARVSPNPGATDGSQVPKFSMQRSRFKPDELI